MLRTRRLIDFLADELKPHLPANFKKFPPDLLLLIAQYKGSFKALCCPITGEVFDNPVFIRHPKIASIVYNDESLALVAEELKPYHLQPEQKIAVPFIKTLVNYVEHELDNNFLSDRPVSSGQREHDAYEIKLMVDEEPDVIEVKNFLEDKTAENNLKNLLRDPLVPNTNNLAHEIKRLINFESRNFQETLGKLLTRYDWPIIQSVRSSEFALFKPVPVICVIGLFGMYFHILTTPGFDFFKPDKPDKLPFKLFFFCFTPWLNAFYQSHVYRSCRSFGTSADSPACALFIISLLINMLHYFISAIGGEENPESKFLKSLVASLCAVSESYAAVAGTQFLAEDTQARLIKPFAKKNLACLLALNSVANIGFHSWYLLANANDPGALYRWSVPLACGFYTLISLPRILVSSQQTATDFKELAQDHHYVMRNTEGFVLGNDQLIICAGKPLLKICSALLMGMLAYVVSDNPIYALVAMIATWNEMSLPNVINGANNRYRLMPPPVQHRREVATPEEKATPRPA